MGALFSMVILLSLSKAAEVSPQVMVDRYRELLLAGYARGSPPVSWEGKQAAVWISEIRQDGSWSDIDYSSTAGGAWPVVDHLRRIRVLARETADPKSALHRSASAERALFSALDHWTEKRYQNPNWWQNQIGVPQVMRDIIVLLGARLAGDKRENAMAVLKQFKVMEAGVGANTVWSAELALMAAALEDDSATVMEMSRLIAGEVVKGGAQGIQSDFSFHQHGARLQQFHYGGSFFQDTTRIAWLLRDTPWAFPEDKVRLLAHLAGEGSVWMSRGIVTVPGTLDRAVSRPAALAGADLRPELALLADLLPERKKELLAASRKQGNGQAVKAGFRAFPHSDFATYHAPAFSFFVKTVSARSELTESIQRENRRGRKLNWGDHYVLTSRSDYVDLPPVWDWELLPGVTSAADIDTLQRRPFVGAIESQGSGASAMDYATGKGDAVTLTARKFWVAHQNVVIGLIGALTSTQTGEPVRTALDQRRLRGAVTVADAEGTTTLPTGRQERRGVAWIHHDGLVYVPLGAAAVSFSLGPVSGAWRDINLNGPVDPVSENIFLAVLEHGLSPQGVASGFVVIPCDSVRKAARLVKKPSWSILRNDAEAQVVRFADGTWMAAFYVAGKFNVPSHKLSVETDAPCLLIFNRGELRASDPSHEGRTVRVRVNARDYFLVCPPGGKTSEPVSF
ncbi:chondroitin AC lyase [Nibricoccus aquaticus]|uniref:Chondroitin AC lyase n=2 Tax=Nibricoccus aquaticus TaxID=2576891 RepID=A0A290Q9Q8_9BACT|nr:chondroitin AC lyase [Nibricoccus aquaticus]